MEVKSEQQFDTINVTDIDVAYPGDLQQFCLRDGQATFVETDEAIAIVYTTGGCVRLYKRGAHWSAIRQRTLRVPIPQTGE